MNPKTALKKTKEPTNYSLRMIKRLSRVVMDLQNNGKLGRVKNRKIDWESI